MPVPPPPISPVPTPAPQRGDRSTFSDRVDAFITWLTNATDEFEAVAQNVYDNAFIAEGSGDVATVGLGIISDGPHLTNIDNAASISAFWTVDATTTGTFPTGGARVGMVINKIYGTQGFQFYQPSAADELWYRRRTSSAWQAWAQIDQRAFGIGTTSLGPYLANIDDTTSGAGFYYVDGSTTGTFPVSALSGFVLHRIYGGAGFQMYQPYGSNNLYYRRRNASAWVAWVQIDNKVSRSGDTISGDFTLAYNQPKVIFNENDQTGAAGYWRAIADNGAWRLDKNTSAARDFATFTACMTIDSSGSAVTNGNVKQGGGTGQGTNVIYLGWGSSGGGLKCQVDSTDQGYIPFSSTNPTSGGTITYANPLTAQAGSFTTLSASGLLSANNGMQVNNAAALMLGGGLATLANNGIMQLAGAGGLNLVFDYTNIQARSNGSATTLNLNSLGGLVQVGSGGLASGGQIKAQYSGGDDKIILQETSSTNRGFITAAAGHCFGVVNAAHTIQALICDNSGNFTAAANITAYSDERLKKNWRGVDFDFLKKLAKVKHGIYDRVDIEQTQGGLSAQGVREFFPEAVIEDPETGVLSLDYGAVSGIAAVKLSQEYVKLREEVNAMKEMIKLLAEKVK